MYSVMRDIPDARKVPMERGWVALYLYATCKFSNLLTLEQWAFEYGLPLFWYALYKHQVIIIIIIILSFISGVQVHVFVHILKNHSRHVYDIPHQTKVEWGI